MNGIRPGYSATHTVELVSQIQEYGEYGLRVGQTLSGTYHSFIVVQYMVQNLSFFVNGIGLGYSATHTVELVSQIQDYGESWLRVGQTLSVMFHNFCGTVAGLKGCQLFPSYINDTIKIKINFHFLQAIFVTKCFLKIRFISRFLLILTREV